MSLVTDCIKIKYSLEGYLPNYPHHLISDKEMCDAFIENEIAYFYDHYPLLNETLRDEYNTLITALKYHISKFLVAEDTERVDLPDWVYSYMMGIPVSVHSDPRDRHYLLVGLEDDNIEDQIDAKGQLRCFYMSKYWVNKLTKSEREVVVEGQVIQTRPPTMFGEPHVIKLLRLSQVGSLED